MTDNKREDIKHFLAIIDKKAAEIMEYRKACDAKLEQHTNRGIRATIEINTIRATGGLDALDDLRRLVLAEMPADVGLFTDAPAISATAPPAICVAALKARLND